MSKLGEKVLWFRVVIDPRGTKPAPPSPQAQPSVDQAADSDTTKPASTPALTPLSAKLQHPANKPVGTFRNPNPPASQVGSNVKPKVAPKPSDKLLKVMSQPNYQPDDRQEVWMGIKPSTGMSTTPPALLFRFKIDKSHLPINFDRSWVNDGEVMARVSIPGRAITHISPCLAYWDDEKKQELFPKADIPIMITKDKQFDTNKKSLTKISITLDNAKDVITQENVANRYVFKNEGVERTMNLLRAMIATGEDQGAISFDVYIQDTETGSPAKKMDDLVMAFKEERDYGNVFRHYYSQNLQLSNVMHNLDVGTSLKDPDKRPTPKVRAQSSYTDLFEMTTRLGVGVIQIMEDEGRKTVVWNTNTVTIRVLQYPGGGDSQYLALLDGIGAKLCLKPGDKIRVNFKLHDQVKEQKWTMVITVPFEFAIQGEVCGTLYRPFKPKEDAEESKEAIPNKELTQPREYQTTDIPVATFDATTLEEARGCIINAKAIQCFVTASPSDRAESRLIKSLNTLAHGTREVGNTQGEVTREESGSPKAFGKILLMHNSVPESTVSWVNDKGKAYLEGALKDTDHQQVIKHITNVPVKEGKGIALIQGYPGTGKTRTTADLVAAILLSNPASVIVVTGPSNSAVDVSIRKIDEALGRAGLPQDIKEMKDQANGLLKTVKTKAMVPGFIINALGAASNYLTLPKVDYLIVDNAGQVNIAELIIPLANLDVNNLLLVGDTRQLTPHLPYLVNPGCTPDLSQSCLQYFLINHWDHGTLTLQRRGPPGSAAVYGKVFYNGEIQDAPCASIEGAHPLAKVYKDFYISLFPEVVSVLPMRYIEVQITADLQDKITGSYKNLGTAAVIVNIAERMAHAGIDIAQSICVTHYAGQQKVLMHAFTLLHREFPNLGFDKVLGHTTDSIQGYDKPHAFADPVRTHGLGFTNNRGRSVVLLSRASEYSTVVGSTMLLGLGHPGTPVMRQTFDAARKLGCCVAISKDRYAEYLTHRYVLT
ncbi:hypothetical protein BP6252_07934 [Coleophoma cylindrospora]|uniref:Uncharacterized protein n=1 Tax=Coleophoma cylindrospora TaxID=1849047 RepID=A0A3D8RBW3_9HELO|nr:hypothetical protein BP6252_07934 [Coleophoma cylindrospora]